MIKRLYYAAIAVAMITLTATSCKDDDDDTSQEEWMLANQQALNAIKTNSEYTSLHSPGNEGNIYYKVLKKGSGTTPILYTNTVSCFYKGWFVADYEKYDITKGKVFDQREYLEGPPFSCYVGSDVITGWKTALQQMVEGDRWEIWVPYQLGYGDADYTNSTTGEVAIPAFSTLVFEIEVVKILE